MSDSEEEEEEIKESSSRLQARPYQTELLNEAIQRNIIVCLGTGTGKTFISVLLIKELAYQIRKEFRHGGKRTFFLVNTVPLVFQQAKVIKDNTSLKVGEYVGEMGVDFWNDQEWYKQLQDHEVLVMTAQIFVDLLGHARIKLSQVNLIVFDECHHAKKEHPYAQVMKYFPNLDDPPRILGLTASVVNGKVKPYKIESEIQNLEAILRAACETSSDDEVAKFATKPNETVCLVNENEQDDMVKDVLFQEVLGPWDDFLTDYRSNSDIHKLAKLIVKECIDTTLALGSSACNHVAELFLKNVVPKVGRRPDIETEDQLLIEYTATQLRQLQRIYKDNTVESSDIDTEHLSPKVLRLVGILKQYGRQKQDPQNGGLCGIVFVERRYTAALLKDLLNRLAVTDEQLSFVKCNFVVGHGAVGSSASDSSHDMSWKKQEDILRKFRRHEFNLLIATSVVEEGLDVPKCNLVVRFDFPKTFQSYVQSKGRARAKPSEYIILASSSEEAVLEMYHAIEEYLMSQCHDRPSPDDEESCDAVNTDLLPPYKTSKDATLRMSNSISMLNRYCSKLPRDSFTPLYADFSIEGVGNDAYQATVKLPINCPIKEKLKGDVMPSKQQAKMAVAYNACKQLHQLGELNEYLLPVEDLSSDEDGDESMDVDSMDGQKPKRGTKRRKQIYQRKVPEVFKDSLPKPGREYFLYAFTKQPSNKQNSFVNFGILLNSKLPEIRPFIIYEEDGTEVIVSIHECPTVTTKLSKSDISLIDKFHSQLMSELLRIPCESDSAINDGYYIVPLSWNSHQATIDFEEIGKTRRKSKTINTNYLKEHESILTPNHRPKERFIVEKICTNLSPTSDFPDRTKAMTYDEYFLTNYKLKTTHHRQPLILVKRFPERINFLVNRKKTKREVKDSRKDVHFIPEHCSLHPFPACLLHDAAELPSILYRITSILLVEEVIQLIANDCSSLKTRSKRQPLGQANLSPIGKTEAAKVTSKNQLQEWFSSSSQRDVAYVDTFLVLQALTTKGSGDAFDLERLEMLGDAFLKQAVSIHLYCSYQNNHEGKLTKRKVKEISNLNLYRASNRKGLPVFMQNTVLDRKTWLTPSFGHVIQSGSSSMDKAKKPKLDEDEERCGTSEQCISDKSVADSIEALIGAYLISCGYKGALNFLDFLGIKVYPESGIDGNPTSSKYANFGAQRIIPLTNDRKLHMDISDELQGFEETIKYKFQDKMFLLQALTHASYQYNTLAPDCYQRLEFLGDAVLDFLVTECLYSSNPNLTPGELTDLRQALVNNNIFAKIAVEHDYHKYLKYTSPEGFRKINAFVLQLEDDRKDGKPQVDDDPFVIMSDDNEGAVEAPKILGDVFESVAGAVFLDSGMDVVKTWKVYHRMMKPYIDFYSKHVPYNPIRKVHENDNDAKFSEAKVQESGKISCQLKVKWGTFIGKGDNKKFAKLHAARLAMDALK